MCTICMMTQTFVPDRHQPGDPIFADIIEGNDAAEDTSTTYSMGVGDTFQGTIENSTDEDWIRIEMTAGTTYQIAQNGVSLSDPLVELYDASGTRVGRDDDSGPGRDALLVFTAQTTGTYYIAADAFSIATGTYALSVNSIVAETTDAAENTSTTYSIAVGGTFAGTIDSLEDEDWVAVTLTAGERYNATLFGGTLGDTFMRLYDNQGNLLESNDDGFSSGTDSRISFTASYTGTYYLEADSFAINYGQNLTGTYELSINLDTPPPPPPGGVGTVAQLGTFLMEGTDGARRTFDTSQSNQITVNLSGLTAEGQQLARWAMEAWEMVANIDFVEVSSGEMITVDDEESGAFAFFPNSGSTANGVEMNVSRAWLANNGTSLDSYSFQTYVHEFGHALGLRHQGIYNGSATYGTDNYFLNDSWAVSIMSYFSQRENTTTNDTFAYLSGAMLADVFAIQELYGAPGASTATSGNTTYGRGSNLNNYMDQIFDWLATGNTTTALTGNMMAATIYDRDGVDTFNFDYLTMDARLDMRAEQYSDFGTNIGVLAIAHNTVIENAILGSGNDNVTGNGANNNIVGNLGNDRLDGRVGNDTLNGGDGSDTLVGGDGDDSIIGGTSANDLRDVVFGGAGNDTIDGGHGNDELRGDAGNDSIAGGFGADTVIGGAGNDTLTGSAFGDLIFGGDGFDFINGGFGSDRVNGGANGDRFFHLGVADHGNDWIQDYNAAQGDVLEYGGNATRSQFQVNVTNTASAGADNVDEAFIIYRPTGQILWALVDGDGQSSINIRIGGQDFDLLA